MKERKGRRKEKKKDRKKERKANKEQTSEHTNIQLIQENWSRRRKGKQIGKKSRNWIDLPPVDDVAKSVSIVAANSSCTYVQLSFRSCILPLIGGQERGFKGTQTPSVK